MSQEAVIMWYTNFLFLSVDNSDWSRNGDFEPTRWEAQANAANIIIEQKCERNPENCVGIISMAGKRVQVLSTLTTDQSRVLNAIKGIFLSGDTDFLTSLNIAQLTLKHRQNKNQKQRIVLFVCSPVKNSIEEITLVGRKLKKNNVAIDIISYGNVDENAGPLKTLIDTVNNNNNSHILEVQPGFYLVDSLFSSPIINNEMENFDIPNEQSQVNNIPAQNQPANLGVPSQGVGMSQFEKDINIAIQNSLMEETKKKEEESKKKQAESQPISNNVVAEGTNLKIEGDDVNMEENEEEELEKARLLSLKVHEENVKMNSEKDEKEKDQFLNNEDFIKDVLKEINSGDIDDNLVRDVMNKLKNDEEKEKLENTPNEENKKDG